MANSVDQASPQDNLPPLPLTPLQSLAETLKEEFHSAKSAACFEENKQSTADRAISDQSLELHHAIQKAHDAMDSFHESADNLMREAKSLEKGQAFIHEETFSEPQEFSATVPQVLAFGLERMAQHATTYLVWLAPLIAMKLCFNGSLISVDASPKKNLVIGGVMIALTLLGYVGAFQSTLKSFMAEDGLSRRYPSWFAASKEIASYYGGYLLLSVMLFSMATALKAVLAPSVMGVGFGLKIMLSTVPLSYILATYGQMLPAILLNRKSSFKIVTEQTKGSFPALFKAIFGVQALFLGLNTGFTWVSFKMPLLFSPENLPQHLPLLQRLLQGTAGMMSLVGMVLTLNIIFAYYFMAGHANNPRYSRDPVMTSEK
jgi:hypothetical protein